MDKRYLKCIAENYGGTADMGLDEKCVIAEPTAKQFGIVVGDFVELHV